MRGGSHTRRLEGELLTEGATVELLSINETGAKYKIYYLPINYTINLGD